MTFFFISRQRLLKQQQEALENRLLSLRMQLNTHFIFNALTAVQNYMLGGKDLREDLREAVRYLSNFAKVMRAFLEYNQEETRPTLIFQGFLQEFTSLKEFEQTELNRQNA